MREFVAVSLITILAFIGIVSLVVTDAPWHGFRLPGLVFVAYIAFRLIAALFWLAAHPAKVDAYDHKAEYEKHVGS